MLVRQVAILLFPAAVLATVLARPPARALMITPNFDSSITTNANAAAIEGAIDTAINTIDGLYGNPVGITVLFTYDPAGGGNLLSTSESLYAYSYASYVAALTADSVANPGNTVLATAVANLSHGNDSTGASAMAISGAQSVLLALYGLSPSSLSDAVININSQQPFDFSRPVSSGAFDAIGGLEHELDEVLGGGGSTLNLCQQNSIYCGYNVGGYYGALDLYRYAAPGTPSYTTADGAPAYLSVDGGNTGIAGFNQNSGGDYADFSPACGPSVPGQYIQNAFTCSGQDENYTRSSPEYQMLEAIGWDPVPEPATLPLLASSLLGLGLIRRRRR